MLANFPNHASPRLTSLARASESNGSYLLEMIYRLLILVSVFLNTRTYPHELARLK